MLDLTLVLRYLSGDPLKEELQERKAFIQESVIPVMDKFLLEVRDKQVRRPVLYVDYFVTSKYTRNRQGRRILKLPLTGLSVLLQERRRNR